MKRLICILSALVFSLNSMACYRKQEFTVITRDDPYIVENSTEDIDDAELSYINNISPIQSLAITSFVDYCESMVDREPLALIIVRVENTKTIYWNDLNGDHGGYGITEVSLIKIIAENESMKKIGFLSDAGNLMFWEPYTISVDGSIIYPMYTYQQFSERLFETREINPIMKSGNYYLIAFNAGRFLTSEYESVCYRCYMNENAELGDGSGVRINNKDCPIYNKYRDTFFSPLMSIYEFDTEAFERSAEIVAQYEREGKARTDGTYYLYHAMVVDGWNLYKGVLESVTTE